ncbi:MAG: hypothetical protein NTZ59_15590, partial [Bacteroidetes bacterium]|nr:hypothetical protein [Bacteroidota bacterium]
TKVSYPTAFIDMANLILKFNDVHTKLAAGTSPLDAFIAENQIDLAKDNDKVQQAITYNTEATKKAEESAKETQLFNNVWQPVVKQLTNIGNYLMGIYVNAPRKTSDWGFAIDESPTTAKEVNTKIKLGEQVVLNGVVIGSTIKNTGNADIHIYKGKKTTGNPIIVKPGDTFGVQKGFSIMTINNPDTLQPASLTAMRNK